MNYGPLLELNNKLRGGKEEKKKKRTSNSKHCHLIKKKMQPVLPFIVKPKRNL
jgi:hypothetical protein